jgi:hypothetical protein
MVGLFPKEIDQAQRATQTNKRMQRGGGLSACPRTNDPTRPFGMDCSVGDALIGPKLMPTRQKSDPTGAHKYHRRKKKGAPGKDRLGPANE